MLLPLFILSAICSYFLLKELKKDESKQKNRDKIKQRAQKAIKSREEKQASSDNKVVTAAEKNSPSPGKSKKSHKNK